MHWKADRERRKGTKTLISLRGRRIYVCLRRYQHTQSSRQQQENIKDPAGVGGARKIHLFILLCCLISLRGISGSQSMRSSKENRGESILAQLTEIKRLRRALASGIMEYGIWQPASRCQYCRNNRPSALNYARPLSNVLSFPAPLAWIYIISRAIH